MLVEGKLIENAEGLLIKSSKQTRSIRQNYFRNIKKVSKSVDNFPGFRILEEVGFVVSDLLFIYLSINISYQFSDGCN